MISREVYKTIWQKLDQYKNMIFMAGPRQAGKTTFAKELSRDFANTIYFNWDILDNKKELINNPYFFQEINRKDSTTPLIIFDEIHKYADWKNYLKGVSDKFSKEYKFIISGSGRLDVFQKGGDSLAGRYLLFHLWPFTLAELANNRIPFQDFFKNPLQLKPSKKNYRTIWNKLKKFSGFPEPYCKADNSFYNLWSNTYHKQLLQEDIRNVFQIKQTDNLEILYALLSEKVGNPLSLNNLAQTLQVSYDSIRNWLQLFERFFLTFRISPWKKNIDRALVKDRKLYLLNYPLIKNEGILFENMVAVELWRAVSNWNHLGLGKFDLNFIRNKEKEEVDFVLSNNNQPWLLVECKLTDQNISKALLKFQKRLKIPAIQLVDKPNIFKKITNNEGGIIIVSADQWLAQLS